MFQLAWNIEKWVWIRLGGPDKLPVFDSNLEV